MNNRTILSVPLLLLLLFIFFFSLFISRCYYQLGIDYAGLGEADKALTCFNRADMVFSLADHQRLNIQRGKTLYLRGEKCREKENDAKKCFAFFKEGRRYAAAAVKSDPLDFLPAYWLARIEASLELLFPETDSGESNPFHAAPLFEKAILLRPAGVTVRYDYALYLYRLGRTKAIAVQVKELLSIFPEAYPYIKEAPFFSEMLYPYIKQGLTEAVDKKLSVEKALSFLVDLALLENDDWQAAEYYQRKIEVLSSVTDADFTQVGRLYLRIGLIDKSLVYFKKAVTLSGNFNLTIQSIYAIFCQENKHQAFIRLAGLLQASGYTSPTLERYLAKSLVETDQPDRAKPILERLVKNLPDPASFYLLAKIARQAEQWGEMEVAAQKAVALDKTNPLYLLLFAEALQNQKKYQSAEEVVTTIIDLDMPVGYQGYARRGMIRWLEGKDMDAIDDWRRAFDLAGETDRAAFLSYISRAYYRQGLVIEAWKAINRALEMEPDNSVFIEWKKTIEK